jgi:hypothetical protein
LLKKQWVREGLFAVSFSSSCKPYFPQPLPQLLPVLPGYLLFFFFFFFFPYPFPLLFLSFLPSFNIFVRPLLEGAREGIINNYHQFYSIYNYKNNFVNFQDF